jgi:hypothetical protein
LHLPGRGCISWAMPLTWNTHFNYPLCHGLAFINVGCFRKLSQCTSSGNFLLGGSERWCCKILKAYVTTVLKLCLMLWFSPASGLSSSRVLALSHLYIYDLSFRINSALSSFGILPLPFEAWLFLLCTTGLTVFTSILTTLWLFYWLHLHLVCDLLENWN